MLCRLLRLFLRLSRPDVALALGFFSRHRLFKHRQRVRRVRDVLQRYVDKVRVRLRPRFPSHAHEHPALRASVVVQRAGVPALVVAAAQEELVEARVPRRGDAVAFRANLPHHLEFVFAEDAQRAVALARAAHRRVDAGVEERVVRGEPDLGLLVRRLQTVENLDDFGRVPRVPHLQRAVRAPREYHVPVARERDGRDALPRRVRALERGLRSRRERPVVV
eukprot:29739-Pelagococcus_subviridis.AAC.2